MMKSSNNILIDALSLYWAATKRVGPKNRDDIFYTGFAVSLLTVTQLALAVFVAGTLGSGIIDNLSSAFVTALILVLAGGLAILNSLLIFSIDKRKSRGDVGAQRRSAALAIIGVYFVAAITCAIMIFAWKN